MLPRYWKVCCKSPVFASQSRRVVSIEAEASRWRSCENATSVIQPSWPSSIFCKAPVSASQRRTVWSSEADASRRPSGKNFAVFTLSSWPSRILCSAPVSESQRRTVVIPGVDTSRWPLGENVTVIMRALWPSSIFWRAPVSVSRAGRWCYMKKMRAVYHEVKMPLLLEWRPLATSWSVSMGDQCMKLYPHFL